MTAVTEEKLNQSIAEIASLVSSATTKIMDEVKDVKNECKGAI